MATIPSAEGSLQDILTRHAIQDAMARYARAVDRSDWAGVRAAYHPDAYDDHGDYKGHVDGLIHWLETRFANAENGMHFLGNCLIEQAGPDLALVETYFVSQRLRPPNAEERRTAGPKDAICRQGWGRYVDRFERRNGEWRVARRTVVLDATFTFVARDAVRSGPAVWGLRSPADLVYTSRREMLGAK